MDTYNHKAISSINFSTHHLLPASKAAQRTFGVIPTNLLTKTPSTKKWNWDNTAQNGRKAPVVQSSRSASRIFKDSFWIFLSNNLDRMFGDPTYSKDDKHHNNTPSDMKEHLFKISPHIVHQINWGANPSIRMGEERPAVHLMLCVAMKIMASPCMLLHSSTRVFAKKHLLVASSPKTTWHPRKQNNPNISMKLMMQHGCATIFAMTQSLWV